MTRVWSHWLWVAAGTVVVACGSGDGSGDPPSFAGATSGQAGDSSSHMAAAGAGGGGAGAKSSQSPGAAGVGGAPRQDSGGAGLGVGTGGAGRANGEAGNTDRGTGAGTAGSPGAGGAGHAGDVGGSDGGLGRERGGATGRGGGVATPGVGGAAQPGRGGAAGRGAGGTAERGAGGAGGRGTGGGGSARGGAGGAGGAGQGTPGNCNTPPEASPLVGWAAVSGNGLTTTTGGGEATPITVTSLSELQAAVKGTTPAVVYVKGTLSPGTLTIGSNKTIVGLCGAEIHGHVGLNKSSNVIIRNIKIVGYGVGDCSLDPDFSASEGCSSGSDAISIQGQSHHLWFDHDDISDGTDGNLDLTHATDYVTISWTKFHYTARTDNGGSDSTGSSGHRFSNLVGHDDDNASEDTGHLRITWHHDWWADNVAERQPRIRFGQNHLFNNLWTSAGDNYCIGVGVGANIRAENNVFVGVKNPINTTSYSDSSSVIASTGNIYTSTSGSAPADLRASSVFDPSKSYSYTLDPADAVQEAIRAGVGPK